MKYKNSFYIKDGVILYKDRAIIPSSLRSTILKTLHSAHQGVLAMGSRARAIVFWPGISQDIEKIRDDCVVCNRHAPSQANLPSSFTSPPTTPFEQIYADFFEFNGKHYLVIGDRLSGWSDIHATPAGTYHSGARGLVRCLRMFFGTYGVPSEISSDGGPEFMAEICQQFLRQWGVRHRVSSAYFARSNGRAEVAVKSAKRLLRNNVGPGGSLDNNQFLRAILQLRNTPDPNCNVSPAQILFGRPIRDHLSFTKRLRKFSNPVVHRTWRKAWCMKETALRMRYAKSIEQLNVNSNDLPKLKLGDRCFVQNQSGNYPLKWERSGIIVEILHQYIVKIDGSGRLTRRNRKFLRRFKLPSTVIQNAPSRVWPGSTLNMENRAEPPAQEGPVRVSAPTQSTAFVPLMVRRLQPFNNPGLREGPLPVGRLRPR